jgi:hypothetical protein
VFRRLLKPVNSSMGSTHELLPGARPCFAVGMMRVTSVTSLGGLRVLYNM